MSSTRSYYITKIILLIAKSHDQILDYCLQDSERHDITDVYNC